MLALATCLVLAACAGPQVAATTSSDQGSDMQSSHNDLSKWVVGPDNGQY